ncbi:hypothetical protein [Kitasatospora sp. NPDC096204]|uniref:hypothetical protein n=1 Tax=Kitasatospora sp. NPDC096204 TaxID=3364094 RepID=UPI0038279669
MSETLVKTDCGCVVRGGFHTFDYEIYTVEVQDRFGGFVRNLDVIATSDESAIAAARGELHRRKLDPERSGWGFESIGFLTARASCCITRNRCLPCQIKAERKAVGADVARG